MTDDRLIGLTFPTEPSRDADAWIAEHVFGWEEGPVPPDAEGDNEGIILMPPEGVGEDFTYPPKGKVHRAYHCPAYTTEPAAAAAFAMQVGVADIPVQWVNNAWRICEIAMNKFRSDNGLWEDKVDSPNARAHLVNAVSALEDQG